MIYELRVYQPLPGKMAKLQDRFRDQLLSIWDRHGIRPVGFWTTLLGESSNELTYILAWESLADRERKWTAFQEDLAQGSRRKRARWTDRRNYQQPDPHANSLLGAEVKIRDSFSRTTIERAFDAAGNVVTRRMLGCFRDNALTRQDFHGYRIGWK